MGNEFNPTQAARGTGWVFLENKLLPTESQALRPPDTHTDTATSCPSFLPAWAHLYSVGTGLSGRVDTFVEGAWGEAGDLGQDREEGPQTRPLGLPALEDFEDTQAHICDLQLFVTLHIKHKSQVEHEG